MKDRQKLKQRIADMIWQDRHDYGNHMPLTSEEIAERIIKVFEEEQ
jgi:hypothetical protein